MEIYRYKHNPYPLGKKLLRIQTMKSNSSSYVLAAEILIVILFHVVKIKQSEKHPGEMAFAQGAKTVAMPKLVTQNKTGAEYMLVNLVK
jgi:hypothetical protein